MKYLTFQNFDTTGCDTEKQLKLKIFDTTKCDAIKQLIQQNATSATEPEWVQNFLMALTSKNKIPISGYGVEFPLKIRLDYYADEPFVVHICFNLMDINTNSFNEYIKSKNKSEKNLYKEFSSNNLKSFPYKYFFYYKNIFYKV
jgi:hypothetical protein